ncbi:MAG: AmmeMemoRadiSam system protein B, partial [Nitrososphaerota archaeon]
ILGTKNVRLLKYATSGDVTGDRSAVVGYASILIELEESR